MTPRQEDAGITGRREVGTFAMHQGGGVKDTSEFPTDKRGVPFMDAAGFEVLKAYRYFTAEADEPPAIVAALLTVAWAIRGKRHA